MLASTALSHSAALSCSHPANVTHLTSGRSRRLFGARINVVRIRSAQFGTVPVVVSDASSDDWALMGVKALEVALILRSPTAR
jgi:hypothetical protein